jgi:hypothetical protein
LLRKPFGNALGRESSTANRFFSLNSSKSTHQPSQHADAAFKDEAVDAKGARHASKRNTIFKAVIEKWRATRQDVPRIPDILKRNDGKNSSRSSDSMACKPRPDVTYERLIEEALLYSGKASLSAKEICKHIMDYYKWYKDNHRNTWQVGHSMPICLHAKHTLIPPGGRL